LAERRLLVAITGASGAIYAKRFIETAASGFDRIYLTASENALSIMKDEIGLLRLEDVIPTGYAERFTIYDPSDVSALPCSGSHAYEGAVVIPCSMGTVGRIAAGVSNDLVTRAADVCLKERRKLALVIRETPLSLVHLENLTLLARSGALVLPACPAFYQKPKSVDELVDFVVERTLAQFGITAGLVEPWNRREE